MKNFIANFISIILIPLFAPTYLFCIILFYFPHLTTIHSLHDKLEAIAYIFAATTLLPFVFVFILFKLKKISSITLDDKKDRVFPQLFSCFNYLAVTLFLLCKLRINDALSLSMIAITVSLIAITITTRYWKISTHTSGVSGIFAIATVLYLKYSSDAFMIPYLIILFLMVSVCIARLHLKVHTPLQIIGGCLLGGIIGFSLFYSINITITN